VGGGEGGGSCNNTGKTRGRPAEKWRGSFLVGGLTHPKGKLRGNPKPDPVREISWVVPPPPPLWADLQEGGEVGVISSAVNLGYVRLAVCILRCYSEHGPAHQEDFEKRSS